MRLLFLPPTKSFEPLGMSFTASSAVEQNTGFKSAEDVENRRCFEIHLGLLLVSET